MDQSQIKVDVEAIMREIRTGIQAEQAAHVDVEQIMREIREQVRREAHEPIPDFHAVRAAPQGSLARAAEADNAQIITSDGGILQQIANEAKYLKENYYVPYYREMGKGWKLFIKRAVRRLCKCFMFPLSEQQNQVNQHIANGIDAAHIVADYHQEQFNNTQQILSAHQAALEADREEISCHGAVIGQLQRQSQAEEATVQQLRRQMDDLQTVYDRLAKLERQLAAQTERLDDHDNELAAHREQLDRHEEQFIDHCRDLTNHGEELAAHRAQLVSHEERLTEQNINLVGHGDELAAHRAQLVNHEERLNVYGHDLAGHGDELAAHRAKLQTNDGKLNEIDKTIDDISLSIARVIRHYLSKDETIRENGVQTTDSEQRTNEEAAPPEIKTSENAYESLDYFKFQNDFRGTQSQIMERQRIYIPYFQNKNGKVFDLGCGRGEFLRLMKEQNIPAFGVDTYPEYEVTGKLYDIDIRTGDGIAMLERMEEKLGGIFCAQVIEHLDFKQVEKLCKLAYEKLEKGACLILETPNSMCVSIYTNTFYLDPTHQKPVHPLLMEYLLKSIGYSEVQLIWPDHSLEQLPHIESASIDNLDEVNRAIERVSNLLYGSQDYAVIARK